MIQRTLTSQQKRYMEISLKEINKDISVFRATLSVDSVTRTTSGIEKETKDFVSEGIATNEYLMECRKNTTLPQSNPSYVLATKEYLQLLRFYGYPMSLSLVDYEDEKTGFSPLKRMQEIQEENKISFYDFTEEDFKNVVKLNNTSYTVVRVHDNKNMPVAITADDMQFDERSYKNFDELVEQLINSKRLMPLRDKRGEGYIRSSFGDDTRYVRGKVVLTEEEYDRVVDAVRSNNPNDVQENGYISHFIFSEWINSFDFLDVAKYKRSQSEMEKFDSRGY